MIVVKRKQDTKQNMRDRKLNIVKIEPSTVRIEILCILRRFVVSCHPFSIITTIIINVVNINDVHCTLYWRQLVRVNKYFIITSPVNWWSDLGSWVFG